MVKRLRNRKKEGKTRFSYTSPSKEGGEDGGRGKVLKKKIRKGKTNHIRGERLKGGA